MSAEANTAGLFPPEGDQIWNPQLKWQPVPVHTRPIEDDYKLALSLTDCDHYIYLLLEYLQESDRIDLIKQNQTLINYVEMKSGEKLPMALDIGHLYDTLSIEQMQGKWYVFVAELLRNQIEIFMMNSRFVVCRSGLNL